MVQASATLDRPPGPSILPILSVNFVGMLGFSIVVPFMVFLVTKWGGNALVYGAVASTYSIFQLIGAPILGRWSDRYGRRKVLLLSQLGTLVSWAIFLIAFTLPLDEIMKIDSAVFGQFALTLPLIVMFVSRALDGLTGGNVSVANAYLADITTDETRSRNFGRMSISTNLGFVVGPALAGLLGGTIYGEVLPVFAGFLISAVASALIAFGLEDRPMHSLSEDPTVKNAAKVYGQGNKECFKLAHSGEISTRGILALPNMAVLLAVYFLVMFGFSFFYAGFPVYAAQGLGWSVSEAGSYFATLSVATVVAQGPVLAFVSGRIADKTLVTIGALVLATGFSLLLSGNMVMIYLAALFIALGNGVMWPTFMAVFSRAAGERYQGAVQGLAGSLGAAASILGLLGGGLLYGAIGAGVFLAAACVIALVALLSALCRADQA